LWANSPKSKGESFLKSQENTMSDLSSFPITARWSAKDPSVTQLYSYPTPNGVKVSIAL
jgi:hypothetical protein